MFSRSPRASVLLTAARLECFGRSVCDLPDLIVILAERCINLPSFHESIDTTTPAGKLTFHLFAALAEMEAEVLREVTVRRTTC